MQQTNSLKSQNFEHKCKRFRTFNRNPVHKIQLFASKTKRANKIHKRKGKTLRQITFGEEY
jgi:hypothetical protein